MLISSLGSKWASFALRSPRRRSEQPYGVWRDFDPEDSVRFFALRLNEAGFTKFTPNRIVAEHTDWRFLNELKHELKT